MEEYGYYVRTQEKDLIDTETGKPPETPFKSIPNGFWWCMVTLMSVGYGDVVPVTIFGKLLTGIFSLGCILFLALPISVIGTNFATIWIEYKVSVI